MVTTSKCYANNKYATCYVGPALVSVYNTGSGMRLQCSDKLPVHPPACNLQYAFGEESVLWQQ